MSRDEEDPAGPVDVDPALAATLAPADSTPAAPAARRASEDGGAIALGATLATPMGAASPAPGKTIVEATPHGTFSLPNDLATVERARYDVLEEFARGGLGRILRAGDRRTGRVVALKEALSATADSDGRLTREALLTAHLEHPGIVPVYEVGRWPSGEPFYAMKLVAGRPLADLLVRARTLDARLRLVPHVHRVAEALAYAHDHRVIHRDLKPANVIVGDYGETVVLDWGLAKQLGEAEGEAPAAGDARDAGQTSVGAVMGTPWYMPPEQAAGEPVDERADVYALGAILYELLGGAPPFAEATTVDEVLEGARQRAPTPLLRLEPGVPRALLAIVDKAMARRPEDRYPTARTLADDLDRFLGGQLVRAHHYTRAELLARWVRRNRAAIAVTLVSALTLAVVGTVGVIGVVHERDRAVRAETRQRAARLLADRHRAQAQGRLVDLYLEQGRQELARGQPGVALALLTEAARAGGESPSLRFLLARAAEPFRHVLRTVRAADEAVLTVGVAPGAESIFATTFGRELVLWDVATGRERLRTRGLSAAFSPDGARLAIASGTAVQVVGVKSGGRRTQLPMGEDVVGVAWSADGSTLAACGFGGAVALWRAETLAETRRTQAHVHACRVALDRTGARVLTVSDDGAAKLWNAADGAARATLETPGGKPGLAKFSPDGATIATAGTDPTVRIFDAEGAPLARLSGHREPVLSISFTRDGTRLLSVSHEAAIVWEVPSGREIRRIAEPQANLVDGALAARGDTAVVWSSGGVARLHDVRSGELLAEYRGVSALPAFDGEGRSIATGSDDGRVQLRRASPTSDVVFLPHGGRATNGNYSPRGDRLATASADGVARVWDAGSGRLLHELRGHAGELSWVDFSPDGDLLVTSGADGTVRLWDSNAGLLARELRGHVGRVRRAFFSADGRRLFTAGFDREARAWDTASGRALARFGRAPWNLWAAVPSRSGDVLTYGEGAIVDVWDGASGRHHGAHLIDASQILDAAVRPDGLELAIASTSIDAWLLAPPWKDPRRLSGHLGYVYAVAYAPDGRLLATASADGTTRLWSVAEGRLLRVLDRSAKARLAVAFRPDGQVIATGGEDGVARLWDVGTGRALAELQTATPIYNVRFRADGEQVALMGLDEQARLWNVPPARGSLAHFAELLRCTAPFRIERGSVVAAPIDPTVCAR